MHLQSRIRPQEGTFELLLTLKSESLKLTRQRKRDHEKIALILAAASMTLPMAAPAQADPPSHAKAWGKRAKKARIYDDRGYYVEPRRLSRGDRIWRDGDRYRCRRDNGTTGLVIGAGLGALAGRTIDTRGDRSAGTLLGAIAGGLLGREIDRGELRCR